MRSEAERPVTVKTYTEDLRGSKILVFIHQRSTRCSSHNRFHALVLYAGYHRRCFLVRLETARSKSMHVSQRLTPHLLHCYLRLGETKRSAAEYKIDQTHTATSCCCIIIVCCCCSWIFISAKPMAIFVLQAQIYCKGVDSYHAFHLEVQPSFSSRQTCHSFPQGGSTCTAPCGCRIS